MNKFRITKEFIPTFVGRDNELKWLDEHLHNRTHSFSPIIISGVAGVGKTELVKYWLSSRSLSDKCLLLDLSSQLDEDLSLDALIKEIDLERDSYLHDNRLIVVIDGSNAWNERQHILSSQRIFNYKVVSSLIFIRQVPLIINDAEHLVLNSLSDASTSDLLKRLLPDSIIEAELIEAIKASKGYPLAIAILTKLLKGENGSSIGSLLKKPLYELSNSILVPPKELITTVAPIMVTANQNLVISLKKQPSDIHKLTPREFEKLLAELLQGMGWEVELTKQTRDGGSDILAYLNTDIGRLLCLVEAKHYREDRKIGIDLVRSLYGTLCDAQANSAMLVTSSSFATDAKEFQQKHKYQLTLRDYADLVDWITKYGAKQNVSQHKT